MSKSKKRQKGMTLVELLAVIVILGLVAGIGTIAIGNIIENSKTEAADRTEEMIKEAAKMFYMDNMDKSDWDGGTEADLAPYYENAETLAKYTVVITEAGGITVTPK